MPGETLVGSLPPLDERERDLEPRLEIHVRALSDDIGERNVFRPDDLAAAASYLEANLRAAGRPVASQTFEAAGVTVRNLEIEHRGQSRPDEVIVVGAHYDSVVGSPGANDNATGVAAVVELARLLADEELSRTVRFVLFVNEEPPFYMTRDMGSVHYARRARQQGDRIVAMFSLETIGYYSDDEGSSSTPSRSVSSTPPRENSSASWGTWTRGASFEALWPHSVVTPRCPPKAWPLRDGSPGWAGRITGPSGSRGIPVSW